MKQKKRALELIKENRYGTTYEYSEDMNPKRWFIDQVDEPQLCKEFCPLFCRK